MAISSAISDDLDSVHGPDTDDDPDLSKKEVMIYPVEEEVKRYESSVTGLPSSNEWNLTNLLNQHSFLFGGIY